MSESLKHRSAKTVGWTFTKTMYGQLRSFVVSLFLARLLSPAEFGTIGMALVFAQFVELFVDFGFSRAIVQAKQVTKAQLSTVFWINLAIGALFSIIMFFSAGLIADFFKLADLNKIVKVFSITFIIKALDAVPSALFEKDLNMKNPVRIEIISSSISGVLGICLAFAGFGVWSLVISQVTGWILGTSMLWIVSPWKPSLSFDLHAIVSLWKFGYRYSLAGIIDNAFWKIDTLIIGKFFSASTLGLFDRAKSLNNLTIKFSFGPIQPVLLSTFSKMNETKSVLLEKVQKLIHTIAFLTCLIAGATYVSSAQLVSILFSDKWLPCVPFFQIICLFSISYTLPNIYRPAIYATGHSGKVLKSEIIQKTLKLIAIAIGLPFGILGYIFAASLAELLGIISLNYFLGKNLNWKIASQIWTIARYYIPAVLLMIGMSQMDKYLGIDNKYAQLFLYSGIYITIYTLLNLLLRNDGIILCQRLARDLVQKRL